MNQPLDLSIMLPPPPQGSPPDTIASIILRCDALGLSHFGDALREFGFVSVEGHGVDSGLIRRTYSDVARFFDAAHQQLAGDRVPLAVAVGQIRAHVAPGDASCPVS